MNKISNLNTGKKGETLAIEYLQKEGYEIIATNWRYKHKEIDIIAQDKNVLVVVEIKTRKKEKTERVDEIVDSKKQKFLIEATEAFVENYSNFTEVRFDVIIIYYQKKIKLIHIKNAYFAGL